MDDTGSYLASVYNAVAALRRHATEQDTEPVMAAVTSLRKHADLLIEMSALREKYSALQAMHDELVECLLSNAPECWDSEAAPEAISVDYVKALETGFPGGKLHRCHCDDGHCS